MGLVQRASGRKGGGIEMIYYREDEILIRNLQSEDVEEIVREERAQGWNAEAGKYERRLRDQNAGRSIALAAEYQGAAAGYVNVYFESQSGAFAARGCPEIVDFGVLEKYRRHGIGSRLMDVAEELAGRCSEIVCLGVGLHSGYGSAQRMYVKRGYIPDGSGVWYKDAVCRQYAPCCNDDDLVLYLYKRLSGKSAEE